MSGCWLLLLPLLILYLVLVLFFGVLFLFLKSKVFKKNLSLEDCACHEVNNIRELGPDLTHCSLLLLLASVYKDLLLLLLLRS